MGVGHPELHRHRADRLDVLDHALPPRARRDELRGDVRKRSERDAEQDLIEVGAQAQGALLDGGPVAPERGERRALASERLALDELARRAGCSGQHGRPVHVDERVILTGAGGGLPADDDALDVPLVVGELEPLHAVEELEPDATPPQHLVQRRDDGLPHARAHLVEDGAAVAGEHAHHPEQGEPRASTGAVAEGEVVEGADQPARHRQLGGAVLAQPVAELDLVERLEPAGRPEDVVAQHADQADGAELEDGPQAPQLGSRPRGRPTPGPGAARAGSADRPRRRAPPSRRAGRPGARARP